MQANQGGGDRHGSGDGKFCKLPDGSYVQRKRGPFSPLSSSDFFFFL